MYTAFIADLHLGPQAPAISDLFLGFLHACPGQVDKLYILGDLFEYWIGDDEDNPSIAAIKQALLQTTQQDVTIYLMQGNRDFLLGKRFANEAGCVLLPDPHLIDLFGTLTMLTHGDRFDGNKNYQRYRRIVHNRALQWLFKRLPLSLRHRIAAGIRSHSQALRTDTQLPDSDADLVKQYLAQHPQLISGHTHRPSIEYRFQTDSCTQRCYVLSDWHNDRGNVLLCDAQQQRMLYFRQDEYHLLW